MKKIILFCTRFIYYWILIPLAVFFVLCVKYHNAAQGALKLFPLEILLIAGMIFVIVYFARLVIFSEGKVRDFGYFTNRDSASLNADKTLILTLLSRHRVKIEVFGTDGKPAELDWAKDDEPLAITLYRARALCGKRKLSALLSLYHVEESVCRDLLASEGDFSYESDQYVLTRTTENDRPVIRYTFKVTFREEKPDDELKQEKKQAAEAEKKDGYHFRMRDGK